jgi:hypothetical protein
MYAKPADWMPEEQASCFHPHYSCAMGNHSSIPAHRIPRKKLRGKVR